eukprot:13087691-Alexandrium_andersonii.AAC.1
MQGLLTPSASELTPSSGHHAPFFPLPHMSGPLPASNLEREPALPNPQHVPPSARTTNMSSPSGGELGFMGARQLWQRHDGDMLRRWRLKHV